MPVEVGSGSPQPVTVEMGWTNQPDMRYCGSHPTTVYGLLASKLRQRSGSVRDYGSHKAVEGIEASLTTNIDRQIFTSRSNQLASLHSRIFRLATMTCDCRATVTG